MKNLIFLLLPLLVFSYYDFSLRNYADVSELLEDPFTDYYLNPGVLAELKERFLGFGIYGSNGRAQFTNLSYVNINKLIPYALIFNNFETEFSSEKNLILLLARKRNGYSYGFKFQIGKTKSFYEEYFLYEKGDYYLEREGPMGDSTEDYFFLEDYYSLEKVISKESDYFQEKRNSLLFPLSFYLKFRDWDFGVDLKNSLEKRINTYQEEEEALKITEEYDYEKEGDTSLLFLEEYLAREVNFYNNKEERIESLNVWNKDISLFFRKKFKGIRDKKILFTRLGYSSEIGKGSSYKKKLEKTYESSLEWRKEYEDGEWNYDLAFFEESTSKKKEFKERIKVRRENLYQEGGFSFTYYFPVWKLDNTLFLGIKERIDFLRKDKEWEKKGKIIGYLGNNFERGNFSFFPVFIPYLIIEKDKTEDKIKINYNYQIYFDLKLKMFDFLSWRFSYLLPGEKEGYEKWVLTLYLNY